MSDDFQRDPKQETKQIRAIAFMVFMVAIAVIVASVLWYADEQHDKETEQICMKVLPEVQTNEGYPPECNL